MTYIFYYDVLLDKERHLIYSTRLWRNLLKKYSSQTLKKEISDKEKRKSLYIKWTPHGYKSGMYSIDHLRREKKIIKKSCANLNIMNKYSGLNAMEGSNKCK